MKSLRRREPAPADRSPSPEGGPHDLRAVLVEAFDLLVEQEGALAAKSFAQSLATRDVVESHERSLVDEARERAALPPPVNSDSAHPDGHRTEQTIPAAEVTDALWAGVGR